MKIAICDDDRDSIKRYKEKMQTLCDKNKLPVTFVEYQSAKELLFNMEDIKLRPDVLYLDIGMPEMGGVEAAYRLREMECNTEIVFLTRSREYMLAGYDVEALHYIVKNEVTDEKFEDILLKAAKRAEEKATEMVSFTCAGETRLINLKDIYYFEMNQRIVTVYYKNDSFEFYSTLGKIENLLCTKGFIRVHRAFIVGAATVKNVTLKEVEFINGVTLPVGRKYQQDVKEYFSK